MNGFWQRLSLAVRCFLSILFYGDVPNKSANSHEHPAEPGSPRPATAEPAVSRPQEVERSTPETFDRAVQMLALLQRDGRLIDFLTENISPYPDAQLGAAVRTIHESCRKVLEQYVKLEPILSSEEDQPVTVQSHFDPAVIKLLGNVTGQPPIRGLLRHKGWQVKDVNLPPLPQGSGRMVIAPAEVEIS